MKTPVGYSISTDNALLDREWVASALIGAYWGAWLKPAQIDAAIDASLCFGLYRHRGSCKTAQIGFARVVTDGAIFSSVMDVVIHENFRRMGYGTALMQAVVSHPKVAPTICVLDTRSENDAFYEGLGFGRKREIMQRDPV